MEMKNILSASGIIGVISNYKINLINEGKVKDLEIKNNLNALKMVGLSEEYLEKEIKSLTLSEKFKIDLASKLHKNPIIIGNLSSTLNYKDQEYIKKLLNKLHSDYYKNIVIVDNNVKVFFNLATHLYVIRDKKIVYETNDFYDDNLYKYTKMPKIIEFIKYTNRNSKVLNQTLDIYELIKDIYRSVS